MWATIFLTDLIAVVWTSEELLTGDALDKTTTTTLPSQYPHPFASHHHPITTTITSLASMHQSYGQPPHLPRNWWHHHTHPTPHPIRTSWRSCQSWNRGGIQWIRCEAGSGSTPRKYCICFAQRPYKEEFCFDRAKCDIMRVKQMFGMMSWAPFRIHPIRSMWIGPWDYCYLYDGSGGGWLGQVVQWGDTLEAKDQGYKI